MGAAVQWLRGDRQRGVHEMLDTVYDECKDITIGWKPIFVLLKI
jgi:hypothetical protein